MSSNFTYINSVQDRNVFSHERVNKAIYNKDSRSNLCDLDVHNIDEANLDSDFIQKAKRNARSVAVLVHFSNLMPQANGDYKINEKRVKTLREVISSYSDADSTKQPDEVSLAPDVKFADEPCFGFATAFLVGKGTVFTAAHCVCEDESNKLKRDLSSIRVVFNFQMLSGNQAPQVIPKDNVYKIKSIKAHRYTGYSMITEGKETFKDWAIVKLDREVKGIDPLEVSFEDVGYDSENPQELYMLGHPKGLPLKIATSGKVIKNVYLGFDVESGKEMVYRDRNHPDIFSTDLPAYKGNSGSPVFSAKHRVIGMLFKGNVDHKKEVGGKVVKAHPVSDEAIENYDWGLCQKVAEIPLNKRSVALKGLSLRGRISGWRSFLFERQLQRRILEAKETYDREDKATRILAGLGLVLFPLAPIFGVIVVVKTSQSSDKRSEVYEKVERKWLKITKVQKIFNQYYPLNYQEAYLIRKHIPASLTREEMKRLSITAKNMCAFSVSFEKASKIQEVASLFLNKFAPTKILELISYEEMKGSIFTRETRKKLLKRMSSVQADGTLPSLDEAMTKIDTEEDSEVEDSGEEAYNELRKIFERMV
ncbi:hypothetical protein PHSC3_001296 [Chlamydiales bacterium STE3]|nr:hypothetical protein PHSC3_001296 [Chlamydiales bacterium STE3]